MDRININGQEWVRLHDVCDILRHVANPAIFENTDKVIDMIAHLMFYDEIRQAKTDEEREAAKELPGDFVVCQKLGHVNPNGKRVIYFMEFADGEGRAIDSIEKAMFFEYKSMAEEVAKKLKGDWKVICMGIEDGRIVERVAKRLFGDENEEEVKEEEDNE